MVSRLSHAFGRSVACKWRATMFSFSSKVYFLWLYGGGGCKHPQPHSHTHQHNTCVTYTVFIWSFSTFSELYVVCIAYSMRCTKPSILFAIENVRLLSRSPLLRVWAIASFERIISCKIRRCHFVFVFMHTAYNHTPTPTPTHSHIRARTPFSLRDEKGFSLHFSVVLTLTNFWSTLKPSRTERKTKAYKNVHSLFLSPSLSHSVYLFISFTVLNSENSLLSDILVSTWFEKDQRSKWKSEKRI